MSAGIGWIDLTAEGADGLRDFYSSVTGMGTEAVSMGDYDDYSLKAPGGDAVAGVCHRRGPNADVPTGWLIYFVVPDLDAAIASATAAGGEVLKAPPEDSAGDGRMAFLRDPEGNAFALFQGGEEA